MRVHEYNVTYAKSTCKNPEFSDTPATFTQRINGGTNPMDSCHRYYQTPRNTAVKKGALKN